MAQEPLPLSLDVTCMPDTFRPDEHVAIECVTRLANEGVNTATGISLDIGGYSGPFPSYFFVWFTRDGEPVPISTGQLSFPQNDVGPGETAESRIVVLLEMAEGTFETELRASVGGEVATSAPVRFVAIPGAPDPSTDLMVTKAALGEVGEEAQPTATYETTITNRGPARQRS